MKLLILHSFHGTHHYLRNSTVESVICVPPLWRRLAVSKFQDTRTVTLLGCIETKSSRRATLGVRLMLGRDHTNDILLLNDITHYTPFSLWIYIYTHTTGVYIYNVKVSFEVSTNCKLKTVANHSHSYNPTLNHEAQTSVRSINSFRGRVTLANSILVKCDPYKMI